MQLVKHLIIECIIKFKMGESIHVSTKMRLTDHFKAVSFMAK
jgi:hypothetical protein